MTVNLGVARPLAWSEPGRTTLEIKTGSWRARRPLYVEATAPCRIACPAGEPIARWIERARAGDYPGAWSLIREENPFPAISGRVCAHPCEPACNRAGYDGAVAVNALEQFVGDWGLKNGSPPGPAATLRGRVAVVGGGPAGLSAAYHLGRYGYKVAIFEAQPRLGGLMRYGIPEYRLPRSVLDREIELALAPGTEVLTGRRLGADLKWESLATYDALFLSTGAGLTLRLGVPGEEARGVGDGVLFLSEVNTGKRPQIGGRLVVVGGGSTAMDVARSARRLGVRSVTVLALEQRDAMPAAPEEVAQALAEGVEIVNGVGVTAIREEGGSVCGVVAGAARLERTEEGGVRPVFLGGKGSIVEADSVLLAIGQSPDLSALPPEIRSSRGMIAVGDEGATSRQRVFAGGDLTSSQRTVTRAIGAGARAAREIHRMLSGAVPAPYLPPQEWATAVPGHTVEPSEINLAYFQRARKAERRELPPGERAASFAEVLSGLDEGAARSEMRRCFTCGGCVSCDNCFIFCPDMAVSRVNGGYRVSDEHCKGCGLCARECPRGALHMVVER